MNILIVTGHPAQVHNFRLVREELMKHGNKVFWLTTKKDIATNLLDTYRIPYDIYRKGGKNILSQIWTLIVNTLHALRYIHRNHIDIVISRCDPNTILACKFLNRRHIVLYDTEHAAGNIRQKPFGKWADEVLVPQCFWYQITPRQIYYSGNTELYYCHPKQFKFQQPWDLLGIKHDERYAVIRFVKWDAYHDVKLVGGFTLEQKRELVHAMSKYLKVFISSESELPADLEPYRLRIPIERMHDVQACASLFVGESATMASESVDLGTPAIYIDEIGRGYTDEEAREGLLWMYRPVLDKSYLSNKEKPWISGGAKECIEQAISIAAGQYDSEAWKEKHAQWLDTKIDCTAWLTWFIEEFPHSAKIMHDNPDYQYQFK